MPVASPPPPGSPLAGAAQPAIERSEASAIRGLRLPQRGSWPAVAIARLIDRDYASGINLRRAYAVEVPASQQRRLVQHMPLPTLAQVAQNRWIGVRWRRDSMRMIHRERQLLVQLTSPSAALIQQFHMVGFLRGIAQIRKTRVDSFSSHLRRNPSPSASRDRYHGNVRP
jgi:hypothetical protein